MKELQKLKFDFIKLQSENDELSITANMNRQKLTQEANINKTLREEKERVEKKLDDSTTIIKSLQEQVATMSEEIKKAEWSKNYYLDKISRLESRETVTQQATDVIMSEFFSSKAQRNTQIDNYISLGKFFFTVNEIPHIYIYI